MDTAADDAVFRSTGVTRAVCKTINSRLHGQRDLQVMDGTYRANRQAGCFVAIAGAVL